MRREAAVDTGAARGIDVGVVRVTAAEIVKIGIAIGRGIKKVIGEAKGRFQLTPLVLLFGHVACLNPLDPFHPLYAAVDLTATATATVTATVTATATATAVTDDARAHARVAVIAGTRMTVTKAATAAIVAMARAAVKRMRKMSGPIPTRRLFQRTASREREVRAEGSLCRSYTYSILVTPLEGLARSP